MSGGGALSDDDTFVLIMISPFLLPVATGAVLGAWDAGRDWALDHNIISDKNEAIVAIPGWDGAGLGGVHVVVGACILILLTVLAGTFSRRRQRRHVGDQPEPPPFRSHL
ncbi:MAG TPA: hypothetical protein VIP77_24220 [Jiangellaceae bacterium]